jgi:hypothetical protein
MKKLDDRIQHCTFDVCSADLHENHTVRSRRYDNIDRMDRHQSNDTITGSYQVKITAKLGLITAHRDDRGIFRVVLLRGCLRVQ